MPFVRNAWYVAALPEEVSETPLGRTILGDPIVLYRQESNEVAALFGLCPHRFASLAMGVLKDGHLQCPYHGLEFDGSGRCVLNPHGNGKRPAALDLRSYPVVERDALIWIWPGDPGLADPADIPDFSCRIDPKRRTVGGYCHVACDYRLLVDNLMDLGHAQYVHRANAATDAFDRLEREVIVEGTEIQALMTIPNGTPSVLMAKFIQPSNQTVDMWNDIRWNKVSAMLNFIAVAPTGTGKEDSVNSRGTHIITPETDTTCHYFFGSSRNFGVDDPAMDQVLRDWQRQALVNEDKAIVEAIEAHRDVIRQHGLKPALLACDAAAVRVAQAIERLTWLETAGAP